MAMYEEYYQAQLALEEEYGAESIVLMMVGSFYEIYGVDMIVDDKRVKIGRAEEAHHILGMSMSLKNKSKPHNRTNPYMVGFPDYAIDEHLGKLLRENLTVAIYDQYDIVYTESGKKSTKKGRKRTAVYTPSTFVDDTRVNTNSLLIFELASYISPISKKELKKVHVANLSLSTGKVHLLEAYDTNEDTGKAESELYRIIHSYNPSEIIAIDCDKNVSKIFDLDGKKIYYKSINKKYYKISYQNEFLKKIYNISSITEPIEFLGLSHHSSVIPHFIQALQFAFEQDKLIVSRIQKPVFVHGEHLVLNNDSIYQLNLIKSPFERGTSLYDIVCVARTAMGQRCVYDRLLNPVTKISLLEKRYDLIESVNYVELEPHLRGIADIEKKYRKMVVGKLQPYELADLKGTWITIKNLLEYSKDIFGIKDSIIDRYECFYNEYMGNFDFSLMKKSKLRDIKGSFFIEGVNEELDKMTDDILEGKSILYKLAKEISAIIDPNKDDIVRVEITDKEGFYLTTTTARFKKLGEFSTTMRYHGRDYKITNDDFEITKLKNTVKIRSPEIRRVSRDICTKRDKMNEKVLEEYLKVLEHYVEEYGGLFTKLCKIISNIDFIYSASKVATMYGYTRPVITDAKDGESYINVTGLRHPIVEQINDSAEYITNDIDIGVSHYGSIIYGLNMSGKSTLLKALGCNLVLAQAGFFTSTTQFEFYPFKHLLSKMTIRDNMAKGQSTFMVEMIEVKNMLMRADRNTLILSDELCSSTESTSGHAIVAQTLDTLSKRGAKFLFSTHLHELQKIPAIIENPVIKIFHFKVHIDNNKIIFDRHIEEGGMTELYGLEVARALGLPDSFMRGAFQVRDLLTGESGEILNTKTSRYNSQVYVHSCNRCGSTTDLHTHHLRHQEEADENGLIDKRFHKNKKFNLEVLCKKCHIKEHSALL